VADSEVRQKFEAYMDTVPTIPDGVDSFDIFSAGFAAGMRAGEIARSEFVIDLLDKRMRKMLKVDAEDGPEGVEIAKAECFHLMEIQRILRGEKTCGVYDDYGKVPAAPEEKKP
jgi:hypothetical protein